jgi:hypothetical protein
MSTEKSSDVLTDGVLRDAQKLVDAGRAEQRQLEIIEPLDAENFWDAQQELGFGAGIVTVMREARKRKGRRPGVRNRRNDDFVRYISQFGQDPAITLMQIQSTLPEELVARSRMLDPLKRQLSYADAQSLRTRCAEALMPYMHSKMPVSVELGEAGDFNLLIPGLNISAEDAILAGAGQFVLEGEFDDVEPGERADG